MLKTKNKYYCLKNRTNRSNPNRIGLVWFGSDFICKVNWTKPNRMHIYLAARMTFNLKTEPNRTTNTPKYNNAMYIKRRKKIHRPLFSIYPFVCWCGRGSLIISRVRDSLVVFTISSSSLFTDLFSLRLNPTLPSLSLNRMALSPPQPTHDLHSSPCLLPWSLKWIK